MAWLILLAIIAWLLPLFNCYPGQLKAYRRWRRGSWARCTGLMYGKRWIRLSSYAHCGAEEYYVVWR